ncbi:hypothetical protein IE53DRAFT_365687 [Violaceomyces palustris]|uniref:Uncharacterized protein n=1 Tax=Violaceomyces palustris TaxID=1673888 RepID=A0ACD0P7X5_9BASI|nr:hypothetical protein IE53DRAFT_365687 [Violaceomyces palustris]
MTEHFSRGLYSEPILPDGLGASNMTAVAEYYETHRIPQRFNPGIVVASIAVSVLGSYATLLLLGKRTSNKGTKNVLLLVLAATTMASVGIWGMHFIGMHMSLRPVAGVSWYIKVNAGFTVLSLFVPIFALILAFVFVDSQVAFNFVRVSLSGILVGLIVSLMHYSASLKTNFAVIYSPVQLVMSIVVACLASTIALVAFFKFRSQWEDSWWKRLLCSSILAGGVSGMHYLGVWGTSYKVKIGTVTGQNELSLLTGKQRNNVLVIAIGVMCVVILFFSTFIAVSDLLIVRDARRRAKKVVVCSATFDKQGRLLVKPDGTMPLMIIETDVNTRDILEALDNRQPTFQWLYSLSWDWQIITPWLKAITARFLAESQKEARQEAQWKKKGRKIIASGRRSLDISESRTKGPQSLADFRDRFVDAANQLSSELGIPFEEIGVLYDHVLPTGTRSKTTPPVTDKYSPSKQFADDESSINGPVPSIFGDGDQQEEGAMLFLVRELPGSSAVSTERFRQRGYRMTETRFLAGVLADRVAVKKEEMEPLLDSLKVYAKRGTRPVVQPGGVYAGLFGVRASTSKEGGLDVLVYNFARHQIPAYRLPDVQTITPEMRSFLGTLDQATMEDAMKICERESIRSGERRKYLQSVSSVNVVGGHETDAEQEAIELMIQFQTALFIALDALHNSVRFYPKICQTARLSAEVLEVPSSLDDSTPPAEMILVQAVLPEARTLPTSYSGSESGHLISDIVPTDKPSSTTPFVFSPYTLFSKSQMMLLRGRQADDFEHEVVLEMRRRYPSSLQQEAEEGRFEVEYPLNHKESTLSSANYRGMNASDDRIDGSSRHSDEKDLVRDQILTTGKSQNFPSVKKWASKLSNDHHRRASKDDSEKFVEVYEHPQASVLGVAADGRDRRVSTHSARSRVASANVDDHEMREMVSNGVVPVLKSDDPRSSSPNSPSSVMTRSNSGGGSDQTSPSSGLANLYAAQRQSLVAGALPAHGSSQTGGASLGIRRFIADGNDTHGNAPVNQGRFAQPADESIAEESHSRSESRSGQNGQTRRESEPMSEDTNEVGTLQSQLTGASTENGTLNASYDFGTTATMPHRSPESMNITLGGGRTGPRPRTTEHGVPVAPRMGSRQGPVSPFDSEQQNGVASPNHPYGLGQRSPVSRPSTAPSGGRREAQPLRPRTAHANGLPSLSQRHRASARVGGKEQDEGSLMARLQADGWYARQIQSLERSPAGTALLGVDF